MPNAALAAPLLCVFIDSSLRWCELERSIVQLGIRLGMEGRGDSVQRARHRGPILENLSYQVACGVNPHCDIARIHLFPRLGVGVAGGSLQPAAFVPRHILHSCQAFRLKVRNRAGQTRLGVQQGGILVIAPLVGYSLSVIAPVFLGLGYSLTCPVAFHQT